LKGQNLKLYKFKSLSNFEFISDDYKSETIPQKGLGQVGQWDIPSTRDFKNTSFKNSGGIILDGLKIWSYCLKIWSFLSLKCLFLKDIRRENDLD
jgi:hypothetical protein